MRVRALQLGLAFLAWAAAAAAGQSVLPASMLDRIGTYVEQYYARAQSVLAIESVTLQPLARDLGPDGFARRLIYELRIEWHPGADGADPNVVRTLVSVNGRPP